MNQREAQAAETKQKFMESAQTLFAEHGYEGTSVRQINRSVGLADGLMYHYFSGGKRDIFRMVVQENVKQIVAAFSDRETIDSYIDMPIEEMLEAAYISFTKIIDEHIDIIRILFKEKEAREIVTKDNIFGLIGNNSPWFCELLRKKHERGEIGSFDFESAAVTMETILLNYVTSAALGLVGGKLGSKAERERLFRYFADIWKNSG